MEKHINKKIIEIVQEVNDLIPVKWEELYISFEVSNDLSGELYFFYKYKEEYHYSLYIPRDFKLDSQVFMQENFALFTKAQELKKIFIDNDLADWSGGVNHVDENKKLSVDFDYSPWLETEFGPYARMDFFMYKYLGITPTNPNDLAKIKPMEEFYAKHNG